MLKFSLILCCRWYQHHCAQPMTRAHCNGTRTQQRNSDSSLQSLRTDAKMLTSYLYYLSPCPGREAPVSCRWYQHLREDQATGVLGSHTQTEQCSTGGMARGTRPACHRRWGFCASKCLSYWWLSVLSTLHMCQAAQSERPSHTPPLRTH